MSLASVKAGLGIEAGEALFVVGGILLVIGILWYVENQVAKGLPSWSDIGNAISNATDGLSNPIGNPPGTEPDGP